MSPAAEMQAVVAALGGDVRWMGPPDGGDVPVAEQVVRMRARLLQIEGAAQELYAAAKALDDKAAINDPLHALSDYTVAYAQMGPLMRSLRRYEREALGDPR